MIIAIYAMVAVIVACIVVLVIGGIVHARGWFRGL